MSKSRKKSCEACIQAKTRCEPSVLGCERCIEKNLFCSFLSALASAPHDSMRDNPVALEENQPLSEPGMEFEELGLNTFEQENALHRSFPFQLFTTSPAISFDATTQPNTALMNENNVPSLENYVTPLAMFEPKFFSNASSMVASTVGAGILRSYPAMMREEKTFPPFIHHCFKSGTNEKSLSLELRNAMAISQLFVNHSPDIVDRIRHEQQRILHESDGMDIWHLLSSVFALLIYILMRISSGPSYDQEDTQLVRTMWSVCSHIAQAGHQLSSMRQIAPWKFWVLIESKRRVNSTLRLMRQLYNLDIGLPYPYADVTTSTPLPASKLLWLSKNEQEWQRELDGDAFYSKLSLHDLMQFNGTTENDHPSTKEWARWYAGTDELGILVVISASLV